MLSDGFDSKRRGFTFVCQKPRVDFFQSKHSVSSILSSFALYFHYESSVDEIGNPCRAHAPLLSAGESSFRHRRSLVAVIGVTRLSGWFPVREEDSHLSSCLRCLRGRKVTY